MLEDVLEKLWLFFGVWIKQRYIKFLFTVRWNAIQSFGKCALGWQSSILYKIDRAVSSECQIVEWWVRWVNKESICRFRKNMGELDLGNHSILETVSGRALKVFYGQNWVESFKKSQFCLSPDFFSVHSRPPSRRKWYPRLKKKTQSITGHWSVRRP